MILQVNSRERYLKVISGLIPDNNICVEIGVLYGDFSADILNIVKPKMLYLIDPYEIGGKKYGDGFSTAYSTHSDYEKVLLRFKNEIQKEKVFIYKNFSHDAVKKFHAEFFDFIYVDASHLFEDVKRDLNDWLPKLKPNGLMCGHDYNMPAVKEAVNDFSDKYGFELFLINETGYDFALIKRK